MSVNFFLLEKFPFEPSHPNTYKSLDQTRDISEIRTIRVQIWKTNSDSEIYKKILKSNLFLSLQIQILRRTRDISEISKIKVQIWKINLDSETYKTILKSNLFLSLHIQIHIKKFLNQTKDISEIRTIIRVQIGKINSDSETYKTNFKKESLFEPSYPNIYKSLDQTKEIYEINQDYAT